MLRLLNETSPAQAYPRFQQEGRTVALLHMVGDQELTLVFPVSCDPRTEVGESLGGSLHGIPETESLQITAEVHSRTETRSAVFLRVKVDEDCIARVRQLVERRGARRVQLDTDEPVLCRLQSLDGEHEGEAQALDVSVTGIRVRAEGETKEWADQLDVLRITCTLPEDDVRFEADGRVRFREEQDSYTMLGLEFIVSSAREYVSFMRTVEEFSRRRLELALAELQPE